MNDLLGGSSVRGGEVALVQGIAAVLGGKLSKEVVEGLSGSGLLEHVDGVVFDRVDDVAVGVRGLLELGEVGNHGVANCNTGRHVWSVLEGGRGGLEES